MGNAWSDLDIVVSYGKPEVWYYNRDEHLKAIKYFRKCVYVEGVSDKIKKAVFVQAYTNLSNMFSQAGRIVYAIESWNKALGLIPNFGMAGCNLCHGLISYSKCMYDQKHSALILRHAYKGLNLYLEDPLIHNSARKSFNSDVSEIQKLLQEEFLNSDFSFKEYSLGRSKRERSYRTWILQNSLYLNPLNDVFFATAIAHDILLLPNIVVKDYSAPVYQGFYNQLKQEYITARYLFYQYKYELPEHKLHYSDRNRKLVDTLDYPQYGFRYENLKNACKIAYSIFDKIAYFLNEYLKLDIDRNKVYFRKIWYEFPNRKVKSEIESLNNLPLRGLYFLSKDFYDFDSEYLDVADPEAKNIAEIRNHLEHKYFKLHWICPPENGDKMDIRFDKLSYSVSEANFESKAYRIIKSAREALIYLSLAVHIEENKHSSNDDTIVMPLYLFDYY